MAGRGMTQDSGRATPALPHGTVATRAANPPPRASPALAQIVSTLLPEYPALDTDERREVERDVASYVAGQIAAMPTFLRLPYRLAMTAFDVLCVPLHGRRFRSLPKAGRESYVSTWNAAPLPPMRDFLKLIRSTALLVYFDHPAVRQRLGPTDPATLAPEDASGD